MFIQIDSSEIIVYLVKKQLAQQQEAIKQVTVSMDEIVNVARQLKGYNATVRVDLSENSFEILQEYSENKLSYNDREVKIKDLRSKPILQIMHQYHPGRQTEAMLHELNL